MTRNDKVLDYVVDRIKKEHWENIDMLLCYGSYINGNANDKSDIDMYFIPRNDKGYELGETFILDGIGYDVFGMSWERVEDIAKFNDYLSPLVGDVKVLYTYSEHELAKFKQLQQDMKERLNDTSYMHNCACNRVEDVITTYQDIMFESSISNVRMKAGDILMLLAEAVAYVNHTYFHKGLKTQYKDLKGFKKQPLDFTKLYHDIIVEDNIFKLKDKCFKITQNTIDFLGLNEATEFPPSVKRPNTDKNTELCTDYKYAAYWYEELSSTFNKIYVCAENNNYILAFLSACCLQDTMQSDLKIKLETTDLLSQFKYDNLEKLASRAKEIELNIINEIEKNHVSIRRVSSVDEL